jgi:anti-anti-sigma factor
MSDLASLRLRERANVVIATVEGEIDVSNTDRLQRELTGAVSNSAHGLLVDLSDLDFLDSSCVHMLYALAERLGDRQQRFAVVLPPNRPTRRTIELTGSMSAEWLHGDLASGLAALGAAQASAAGTSDADAAARES